MSTLIKNIIESADNKFVMEAVQLQSLKHRRKLGKFVLEGAAYIADIPDSSHVEYLLVAQSQRETYTELCEKHTHRLVADKLLELVCDTVTPQGVVAVCRQPRHNPEALAKIGGIYVLCEDVRDPGNFGTIVRTAAAAGASAVFALPGCVDAYSPKVVRASSGAVFSVPIVGDLLAGEVLALLRRNGTRIYAAHLQGETLPYETNLCGDCAFIIGNEAHGISPALAGECDAWLKLPMPGNVQSLNASVAAAILIYESLRQRLHTL